MADITVLVQNVAAGAEAESSILLSPMWVGFQDGGFDLFNPDEAATPGLERLAEDGIIEPTDQFTTTISTEFDNSGVQGIVQRPSGPFFQGNIGVEEFTVDESQDRYFSYASMIVPSNDAFIGNGNPVAFEIFDDSGDFLGADFVVTGDRVWDAGTEENDEEPANTLGLGQEDADTGVDEDETVSLHPGFIGSERIGGGAPGNILEARPDADFTTVDDGAGNEIARISVLQNTADTSGENLLNGSDTGDHLSGLGGDDTLNGRGGRDWLVGGRGSDLLIGGDDDDILAGRIGFDHLLGGEGDDILNGGQGRDRLNGGAGDDTLTGGASIDRFIFNTNDAFTTDDVGVDTITDFNQGQDLILLDLDTFVAIASDAGAGFSVDGEFAVVASDAAAATSSALIVQSTSTGSVFYNPNGAAAGFGNGAEFANVGTDVTLTAGDFILRG
ncbi:MAG: spondin domain-containing protein [Cyanobacteriota bacterium]|nr:spondin domain-containing protein [Cyanobacteriota bacterium]